MSNEKQVDFLNKLSQNGGVELMRAGRKVHREYITRQLSWKGWNPSGFLIAAGLIEKELDKDGFPIENKKLLGSFNRYLSGQNEMSGENGKLLLDAMDRMGIDYRNSPTYPIGNDTEIVA